MPQGISGAPRRFFIMVAGCTDGGIPCFYWRKRSDMTRIPDTLTNVVFYLYRSKEDAETGSRIGGTAFAIAVEHEVRDRWMMIYAVTARHNITHECTVARINHRDGGFRTYDLPKWFCASANQDGLVPDVAVAPLIAQNSNELNLTILPAGLGVWPERVKEEDIGIGDAVFMIGRLFDQEGKDINRPCLRFGNISVMDADPVYNSDLQADMKAILVEMRSQSGYSGSPVLVYKDQKPFDSTTRILGVDSGHLVGRNSGGSVVENAGISCVTPFWDVLGILNAPELVEHRKKFAEQFLPDEVPSGFIPDSEIKFVEGTDD